MNEPDEGGRRMPPLGAGRRAAGLALLGWLDDPRAPQLCRVSGGPGAGKSHLLAWLVLGGITGAAPSGQRIHGVLPAAGFGLRAAVWSLGRQLGVVAHRPADLLAALARDDRRTVICVAELDEAAEPGRLVTELLNPMLALPHVRLVVEASTGGPAAGAFVLGAAAAQPAVLELDDPQWTDRERFDAWCLRAGADPAGYPLPGQALGVAAAAPADAAELIGRVPRAADGVRDLRAVDEDLLSELWSSAARAGDLGPMPADPLLYVRARPAAVTAATEGRDDVLARAWAAAGPALIDEDDPAVRAAVLRTRLLGVDDAAAAALAGAGGAWSGRWARWRESGPGAPGPEVTALTAGLRSQLLAAGPSGTVRTFDAATGRRIGSVVLPEPRPLRGLAMTAGGSVVLLDVWGASELIPPAEPGSGLEPYALNEAIFAMGAEADGELTAVAAIGRLPKTAPAFGDASGLVHWYEAGEVISEQLHRGPVTALAGVALGGGGLSDPDVPLLVSGGLDGAVRLWGPDSDPMAEPLDRRGSPVTAVAVGATAAGPLVATAWADGLVGLRRPGAGGEEYQLRLGSEIRSMALIGTLLVLAMPDGMAAVDVHGRAAAGRHWEGGAGTL
ncbi:hypothetical protein [Kitasatospora sp. NBC_00315]|uniref:hypothetical protein n=1 Tax=Kitasatospora sp. NBC_00315 TaxID=2975963 RepID=UPI0032449A57